MAKYSQWLPGRLPVLHLRPQQLLQQRGRRGAPQQQTQNRLQLQAQPHRLPKLTMVLKNQRHQ
jgi:hypothetical protein